MAPNMSRMYESRFEEVPRRKIPDLLKLLERMMPKSAMLVNIAKLSLMSPLESPPWKSKFLSLDGNLSDADDAFVIHLRMNEQELVGPSCFVIMAHPDIIEPGMMLALEKALDCSKSNVFVNIGKPYLGHFTALLNKHNPGKIRSPFATVYHFLLKAEESAAVDPEAERQSLEEADSIEVRSLTVDDVAAISPYWFSGLASEYIRTSITSIASSAVYFKNELVSWALMTPCGTISFLYTKEGHRGKGYAELTMKNLCKILGTLGLHSVMNVDTEQSETTVPLLEYIGFGYTGTVHWLDNCPCRKCVPKKAEVLDDKENDTVEDSDSNASF